MKDGSQKIYIIECLSKFNVWLPDSSVYFLYDVINGKMKRLLESKRKRYSDKQFRIAEYHRTRTLHP